MCRAGRSFGQQNHIRCRATLPSDFSNCSSYARKSRNSRSCQQNDYQHGASGAGANPAGRAREPPQPAGLGLRYPLGDTSSTRSLFNHRQIVSDKRDVEASRRSTRIENGGAISLTHRVLGQRAEARRQPNTQASWRTTNRATFALSEQHLPKRIGERQGSRIR
jgi:hypothetical protein